MKKYVTKSSLQTKKLGIEFAETLKGGEVICLSGDLGAGKTTFTQGLFKGLKIKGPYTSPTFAIIKHYHISHNPKPKTQNLSPFDSGYRLRGMGYGLQDIYHIDAYRITSKDLLDLGFKDFAGKKNSITIIEWPEKVKRLIPTKAICINFEWINDKERRIILS